MKHILSFLQLGLLLSLVSCDEKAGPEFGEDNTPAYDVNIITVVFTDETGTPLSGLDLPVIGGKASGPLELSAYTMERWLNDEPIPHYEMDYTRILLTQNSPELSFDAGPQMRVIGFLDRYHIFRFTFSCPAIYGNDEAHTFVMGKAGRMLGYDDFWDWIRYDGETIATDLKGYEDPRVPLKIAVKR